MVQIHDTAFVSTRAARWQRVTHENASKVWYAHTSRELVQLVIALLDDIFIDFLAFSFPLQLHPVHICTERDTVRKSVPSCERDDAAFRLRTRAHPTLAVTHRFVSPYRKYPLFRCLFSRHLLLRFMPMSILVLAFIADGSSGGSLVRAESLAMMRPSAISVSILSAVFIGEIVAPRIRCVLDTLRPTDLCPRYFWLVAS